MSWKPIDLDAYAASESSAEPTLLRRSDGTAMLYPGKIHQVVGRPSAGKSFLLMVAAREAMFDGDGVVWIDYDADPSTATERFHLLGVTKWSTFGYLRPSEPLLGRSAGKTTWDTGHLADLDATLDNYLPRLVVIDNITAAMTANELDLERNRDVALWTQLLRRIADHPAGPAVVTLDHLTKSAGKRERYAIGGQAKLADVTGASFTIDAEVPLRKDGDGVVNITCTKDRHGEVLRHCTKSGLWSRSTWSSVDGASRLEVAVEPAKSAPLHRGMGKASGELHSMAAITTALANGTAGSIRALSEEMGWSFDRTRRLVDKLAEAGNVVQHKSRNRIEIRLVEQVKVPEEMRKVQRRTD